MATKLQLLNVRKSFGALTVCRDISLTVDQGQMVCLIGASGSGKSTLLRCCNLLEPVDDGQILLDGADITDPEIDPVPIRQRIGMVFQSYNLFPHMTVIENVLLAPRRVFRQSREQLRDGAETLLRRFGLGDRMTHYPDQLSGGQQQRAAIVRALAMKPEIMLFDEITSALDPELVGEVLDAVRELKSEGMTMIMATHEMGFAREAADKVCFLDKGTIVEEAAPEAIFSAPARERTREFLRRVL
ncbi:MAG: amino acid ABC transporter ATP-binding protein [Proteobacteria bacterium]|nr:amino acid ABC transporter ATP-binding protein [Pseudomonadota bacterium]MBS0573161.1 amino acid ABC transporter ATP-binding protein [Pseudomonadota bacterium]